MTINEIQDEIIEEFSGFDDWMDRYSLLIDLGNELPAMPALARKAVGILFACDPSDLSDDDVLAAGINLDYIIDAYNNLHLGSHFFRSFFELLIGRDYVRRMIMEGASADEIRAMWTNDIIFFKEQRKPYLLYEE